MPLVVPDLLKVEPLSWSVETVESLRLRLWTFLKMYTGR
jgi:hypothetical protein